MMPVLYRLPFWQPRTCHNGSYHLMVGLGCRAMSGYYSCYKDASNLGAPNRAHTTVLTTGCNMLVSIDLCRDPHMGVPNNCAITACALPRN